MTSQQAQADQHLPRKESHGIEDFSIDVDKNTAANQGRLAGSEYRQDEAYRAPQKRK